MRPGISLANKSQLLFGVAVVLILTAALSVPWMLVENMVERFQLETARQLTDAWIAGRIEPTAAGGRATPPRPADGEPPALRMTVRPASAIPAAETAKTFEAVALRRFRNDPDLTEYFALDRSADPPLYRYARPLDDEAYRAVTGRRIIRRAPADEDNAASPAAPAAILLVDRTSPFAQGQVLINRAFIVTAGLVASLLAIGVFWLILKRLILSPVRQLRETTDRIRRGDLTIRADIRTGDEFEALSDAFNLMLDKVEQSQAQLRSMNESLDLKVNELAEANVGLFESNRLKSEFLANVSHELRTPLNSIIGFTELLDELAQSDPQADPKRLRYLSNILKSSRSLLEMINELLDMAKIEAGRMEVNIEPTSVADVVEGLVGIMRPQAQAKRVDLTTDIASNVPVIETDPGKLQQILFNFLSNAIKFTPEGGRVAIAGTRVRRQDGSVGVRISVSDTGPGIPEDMQDVIFEKFRQLDAGHTREHPGTGLGLAICRELAEMLGGTVSFTSTAGEGATFYVDLPAVLQADEPQPLMT